MLKADLGEKRKWKKHIDQNLRVKRLRRYFPKKKTSYRSPKSNPKLVNHLNIKKIHAHVNLTRFHFAKEDGLYIEETKQFDKTETKIKRSSKDYCTITAIEKKLLHENIIMKNGTYIFVDPPPPSSSKNSQEEIYTFDSRCHSCSISLLNSNVNYDLPHDEAVFKQRYCAAVYKEDSNNVGVSDLSKGTKNIFYFDNQNPSSVWKRTFVEAGEDLYRRYNDLHKAANSVCERRKHRSKGTLSSSASTSNVSMFKVPATGNSTSRKLNSGETVILPTRGNFTSNPLHDCVKCGVVFKLVTNFQKSNYLMHNILLPIISHNGKISWQGEFRAASFKKCTDCNIDFKDLQEIYFHHCTSRPIRVYFCGFCEMTFDNIILMINHYRFHFNLPSLCHVARF